MPSRSSRWAQQLRRISSKLLSPHAVRVLSPPRVTPDEKRDIARGAITIVRNNSEIATKRKRALHHLQSRHADYLDTLSRVRADTPEGKRIIDRKMSYRKSAEMLAQQYHSSRKMLIRHEYGASVPHFAMMRAVDSLPISAFRRSELTVGLIDLSTEIPIPARYAGDIVRRNRVIPNEDISGMRRRAMKILRPYLSGWLARLFLRRYYSYFLQYTSSGRKPTKSSTR